MSVVRVQVSAGGLNGGVAEDVLLRDSGLMAGATSGCSSTAASTMSRATSSTTSKVITTHPNVRPAFARPATSLSISSFREGRLELRKLTIWKLKHACSERSDRANSMRYRRCRVAMPSTRWTVHMCCGDGAIGQLQQPSLGSPRQSRGPRDANRARGPRVVPADDASGRSQASLSSVGDPFRRFELRRSSS